MRRIYESDALTRDDDHFTPHEVRREYQPQSFRSINASAWSDGLLPHSFRCRFISVSLETNDTTYSVGQDVLFRVHMKNSLPVPVTVRTKSPILWIWSVDGHDFATKGSLDTPPDEEGKFYFKRGERMQFEKRWKQMFRITKNEWRPAEPGEHTIRVAINAIGGHDERLSDETTIRIEDR